MTNPYENTLEQMPDRRRGFWILMGLGAMSLVMVAAVVWFSYSSVQVSQARAQDAMMQAREAEMRAEEAERALEAKGRSE